MAIFDSYSQINQDAGLNLHSATVIRCGQSFTPSFSGNLASAQFYLLKSGAPTGNITVSVYYTSSILGATNVPIGNPFAVSSSVNATSLTTSYQWITFNFIGTDRYFLVKGLNYVVVLNYNGGDVSNFITVGYDGSSPTHGGIQSRYTASWSTFAGDTCFIVNGEPLTNYSNRKIIKGVRVGDGMSKSS
jgi:hypothetical protein